MKAIIYISALLFAALPGMAQDSRLSDKLANQLAVDAKEMGLYYPASVKRFYLSNGFQPAWIKSQDRIGKTWQAMLILDCVLQFGLTYADYHPYELSYDTLHMILEEPDKMGDDVKARFDIVLTDAMITLMNHLHYGKLNPTYNSEQIDKGKDVPFQAAKELRKSLLEKDLGGVLDVQPKNKIYKELQAYMQLVKGQYSGDCYDIPEADIRLAAINMERLRWVELDEVPSIHVNIPSYSLNLHEEDSVYFFKVIVGKPKTPTPSLNNAIGYFTVAPDWKVPQRKFVRELLPKALQQTSYFEQHRYTVYDKAGLLVNINSLKLKEIAKKPSDYSLRQSSGNDGPQGAVVFRFPDDIDIFLHDSPELNLFKREIKSLSQGHIRVQNATELAKLLLKYDGTAGQIPLMERNIARYLRSNFFLRKPVPIHVTYITCVVKDGQLLRYKDIYNLDKLLENKLYSVVGQLAQNR